MTGAASGERTPDRNTRRPSLAAPVFRARLVLLWEVVWRAVWPFACLAGFFLALALLDALPILPGWLHGLVLVVFAAAALWSLARAVRNFSLPDRRAAERRLEDTTGLSHRPLETLSDELAGDKSNPATSELWDVHQRRMAALIKGLRAGFPSPGVARHDPYVLRAAVALILFVAVVAGWNNPIERLARAGTPQIGLLASAPPPKLELWITPPDYTRLAPLFPKVTAKNTAENTVKDGEVQAPLMVPTGSVLTARVTGGSGLPSLALSDADRRPFEAVDAANSQIETKITDGNVLVIMQEDRVLGGWPMQVIPDTPPAIAFAKDPIATKGATLGIAHTAADDYGLEKITAEIRRSYERGAVIGKEVVELELPLSGVQAKSADETSFHDLAPHAWAGLSVSIKLKAVDVAGQVSYTLPKKAVLPEREFKHPVAREIIAQRKRLTTEPDNRRSIRRGLAEIASRPGRFNHDTVVFLALISARARLRFEKGDSAIEPVRELLWSTALRVEDGKLSLAERELRRLERELMQALNENASDKELDRLMRELEQAMNRYLRALAEQLRKMPQDQQAMPFDPRMRVIEGQDLQRMLQQLRKMLKSGSRDAARQLLSQLRNMMESLRSARMFRNSPMNRQGSRAMRQLQQMIQRQSDLMNRTFRQSRRPGEPRANQSQQGAMTQRQLQEMLRQFRQMMGRMGQQGQQGKQGQQGQQGQGPGQALGRAQRGMEGASRALGRNAPGRAVGPMGEALQNLQQAGRRMMQQMMRQFSRRSGMGLRGQFNPLNQRRDPLGRFPPGMEGMDTRDLVVPDEGAVERAQRILEELRRRSGQQHRPRFELDYIDRLLRRF